MELYNSLKSRLETFDKPFVHWAINQPLTEKVKRFIMLKLQIQLQKE